MPKTRDTRKQRAIRLYNETKAGPGSLQKFHPWHHPTTPDEMRIQLANDYRIWVESWILPALLDLIPELRKIKDKI